MRRLLFGLLAVLPISALIACGPPPPPDPPKNFRTDKDRNIDGEVILLWDKHPEERVVKYRLYRDTDPNGKFDNKIYEGDKTEFIDRNVIVDKKYEIKYFYRVTAVDKDGQEGKPSPVVEAYTINYSSPSPPSGIEVRGNNLGDQPVVEITWQANQEADIDGYYVFRKEKDEPIPSDDSDKAISPFIPHQKGQTQFSWEDNTVEEGKRYYYTVAAVDKGGLFSKNPASLRKSDIILKKVELVSPADNTSVSSPINFSWKEVDNAVGYVLVIQTQQFGGSVVWRSGFLKKASVTYSKPLTSGKKYYWFVFAYSKTPKNSQKEDGNSRSSLWRFIVK